MSGSFIVTGTDRGQGGSRSIGPFRIAGSADVGETLNQPLQPGDNNIFIPTGSAGMLVLAQPGSPALKLRLYPAGANDVGLPLVIPAAGQPPVPTLIPIPPGQTFVVINAAAGGSTIMLEFV